MSDLGKNIAVVITSNSVGRAVLLFSTPILTRLYSPKDVGVAAVITTIIGILGGVSTLRYDRAIVLADSVRVANVLTLLALYLNIIFSLVVLSIVLVSFESLARLLNISEVDSKIIYLIPAGVLLVGVVNSVVGWLQWRKMFIRIGVATIAESLVGATMKILSALLLTPQPVFLAIGNISGSFMAVVIGLKDLKFKLMHRKWFFVFAKKFQDFPKYNVPVVLLNRLSFSLPLIFLPVFFSPYVTGLYAVAFSTINLPVSLISNAVNKVLLKEMSIKKNSYKELLKFVKKAVGYLSLAGLLPFLVLFLWGEEIFIFVFGVDWAVSGQYAQIMGPWLFLLFIDPPIMGLYILFRAQKKLLMIQATIFPLKALTFWLGAELSDDVYITLVFYIGVSICTHVFVLLYATTRILRPVKVVR